MGLGKLVLSGFRARKTARQLAAASRNLEKARAARIEHLTTIRNSDYAKTFGKRSLASRAVGVATLRGIRKAPGRFKRAREMKTLTGSGSWKDRALLASSVGSVGAGGLAIYGWAKYNSNKKKKDK